MIIENLLSSLYAKLLDFIESLFDLIFGGWNWQALFSWLPSDILSAASAFILVCFGIALIRIIRTLLPF